jgi:hypothetical protein
VVDRVDQREVMLRGGEHFALGADASIIRSFPADGSALRSGDFVAVTATRQSDGSLLASRVNILPESMRGLGVGQRPMADGNLMTNATIVDVSPELMTNATIEEVTRQRFTVSFPENTDEVRLADEAQVSRFELAGTNDLIPGTFITASVNDGEAQFVTIVEG